MRREDQPKPSTFKSPQQPVTTSQGLDSESPSAWTSKLKPKMHVYAPGVQGYIPIDWRLDKGGPAAKQHSFEYPASEMLRLEAINETVPVYRTHIRIQREITFGQEAALKALVTPTGEVIVKGTFRYQACDDRKCYVPEDVPLEWRFKYEGLDRQRAPLELQRHPK